MPVAKPEGFEDIRYAACNCCEDAVIASFFHKLEREVEGLQEPYNYRRNQYDGERAFQKVLRLVPEQHKHVFEARETIVWQFHNKRDSLALERRHFGYERDDYAYEYADKVHRNHDEPSIFAKERHGQEAVYRQFCRAAHKRREKYRHFAVACAGQRSRCHDARDCAAKAYQHWHDALAGQAYFAQDFVHDKRHARHIAAVFKHGQEEEQHDDYRDE